MLTSPRQGLREPRFCSTFSWPRTTVNHSDPEIQSPGVSTKRKWESHGDTITSKSCSWILAGLMSGRYSRLASNMVKEGVSEVFGYC